jgi:hypothetical protein
MSQKDNDALDSMLEAMSADEEMEKKIDDFAKAQERRKRIERARQNADKFQKQYGSKPEEETDDALKIVLPDDSQKSTETEPTQGIPSFMLNRNRPDETVVIDLGTSDTSKAQEPVLPDTENTMVYEPAAPAAAAEKTVVMNNSQIKKEIDRSGQFLKREYIDDEPEEEYEPVRTKEREPDGEGLPGWAKKTLIVLGVLILVSIGVFGFSLLSGSGSGSQNTASETSAAYSSLEQWAQNYASLTDSEKENIVNLKSKFDSLTEEEQRQINEILRSTTGKTFDILLAEATAAEKPDSNNDNLANAEAKAKLKDQIAAVSEEISQLQSDLAAAQNKIAQAQSDYNEKYQALQSAQQDLNIVSSSVDSLNSELTSLLKEQDSIQNQIKVYQNQIDALEKSGDELSDDDKKTIEDYQTKISDLNASLKENQARQLEIPGEIQEANRNLTNAQSAYNTAKSESDAAYSTLQDLQGTDTDISDELSEKQQEKSDLEYQYSQIK